jgi:hypothetical protein
MSKKLNLVYEWIGPTGPLTNNRIPTIADLAAGQVDYHFPNIKGDLFQRPHFHSRIKDANIIPSFKLPSGIFLYELNFGVYHYRDRLHNFHYADGLLDNNNTNAVVLKRVRNKEAYFLITLFYEGYLDDEILESMGDYFTQKQIPLTQIIYLTNCANGAEVYADFCKRKNKTIEMRMEYFPVFRIDKCDVKDAIPKSLTAKYQPGPRKKTFLCFNRRYNDHRLMLYLAMVQQQLIDQCYYSMDKTQPEANRSFIDNCKYLLSRFPDMGLTTTDVLAADKLLPLVLDNHNFGSYPMEPNSDPVRPLYNESLVNIITETYFFNKIIHVTEKTYKPIAFMQPFILVAASGSLQHIKDMGFKTFSEFWDESYDSEVDDKKRFSMILSVIRLIAKWSEEEKIKFTFAVKDIVDYNVAHLNTMEDIEIDNLIKKYGV